MLNTGGDFGGRIKAMKLEVNWFWGFIGFLGFLGFLDPAYYVFFAFFLFFLTPKKSRQRFWK